MVENVILKPQNFSLYPAMTELSNNITEELTTISSEQRVTQLRDLIDTLRIADEIANKGYLISSSELADLMDINASAVTSRGDHWSWRNWVVSRVRREGNQILWQLEKVD
jgi:DNA-binding transcriptional MocR family regulator